MIRIDTRANTGISKQYLDSIVFDSFEGKLKLMACFAPSKLLDGKILSLILVICAKKEDNVTIYQVTEIKQKQSTLYVQQCQDFEC